MCNRFPYLFLTIMQRLILALVFCLLLLPVFAAEKTEPMVVQELPYGEVLFDFYQQEYFLSLINLLKADMQGTLEVHLGDGELLKAGLFLSYGMPQRAEQGFNAMFSETNQLSAGSSDADFAEQKNRARYYLAKIAYQRGDFTKAQQHLQQIEGSLPDKLAGKDRLISALISMQKQDYNAVITVLDGWKGNKKVAPYVKYNRGLAFIRAGQVDQGVKILDKLGRERFTDNELLALKDKSNLAIGLFFLKQEEYSEARHYFDRIRLHGPHSTKGLLAAGWADAKMKSYRPALIPWQELRNRNILDPFVQEAVLVIPYALAETGLNKPAADAYQSAVEVYEREQLRLQQSMDTLSSGDFLNQLVDGASGVEMGWMRELDISPQTPEPFYLDVLLSSHRVQESLKNYRDLLFLDGNLEEWHASIGAFRDMLKLRKQRFDTVVPMAKEALKNSRLDNIHKQYSAINSEFISAKDKEKLLAFATAAERDKLARLERLRDTVDARPDMPAFDYLQRRLNFLSGILYWDIYAALPSRIVKTGENLKTIQQEIKMSVAFEENIQLLLKDLPKGFEGYNDKITNREKQLATTIENLKSLIEEQKQVLIKLVEEELTNHLNRIEGLKIQAIFALAQIYDRGTSQSENTADALNDEADEADVVAGEQE